MPEVVLKIDNIAYAGWKSVDVRRSLDLAANSFTLGVTDRWAGQDTRRPIRMGSACALWIDGEKIITGYVDDVAPRYDARERGLEVAGRSKVADLIDCALALTGREKSQFANQNFLALARRLAAHFGIQVIDQVGAYKPARTRTMEAGQRVYEFLEELAREEAVFMTSDADGDLVITRAGQTRLATPLKLGGNVLSAQGQFSMKERFSVYHVTGQSGAWSDTGGASSAHIAGRADDVEVRFRPTVIQAEDTATLETARKRAEWQRNVSYGRSQQVTYTVVGWAHDAGLWAPNHLVRVVDEWMGLDVWWLISEARFRLDDQGQRTEVTVMPAEAFDLVSLPPQDGQAVAWS